MLPVMADRLLITGASTAVNDPPLLACPFTVTTTLPVVAPAGTGTTIEVALQLVGVAVVPLNVTVPRPYSGPSFVPETVTCFPTAPEVGDKLLMLGRRTTVNATP